MDFINIRNRSDHHSLNTTINNSNSTVKKMQQKRAPFSSICANKSNTSKDSKSSKQKLILKSSSSHSLRSKSSESLNMDSSSIFRTRSSVSSEIPCIMRANPIHEVEDYEDSISSVREIYSENIVDRIVYVEKREVDENHTTSIFLEAPREDGLSEELELMMELKISSPVYDSDCDSEESDNLSIEG
ncbi:predicted protein [Chaetoceros tenuissimus]|uniref:Uncharacterized protein n=1 Tax=Chaetoceros tenuissimus TaxID=426638 RepID=A0AAD3DBX6_9STRA|nr:predicted protein [Chaetoceros tenuissimus]